MLLNLAQGARARAHDYRAAICWASCVCMSKRKKPVVFTAKRRKDLVADLGKKDYADIVETAITRMQSGLHLDLFPPRKKFVTVACSDKVKPVLTQFIMENVSQYIEIYRRCMTGKKYLMFEQRWFSHIEQYFTEPAHDHETTNNS